MLIIIGGSGFLGSYTVRAALARTSGKIIAVSRSGECAFAHERIICEKCDVCERDAVDALAEEYGRGEGCDILYLAACHNVDYVEQHPDIAARVNVDALEYFLHRFDRFERLLFSSSDTVYGDGAPGEKFAESSVLRPVNVYGTQKALAERLVCAASGTAMRLPFLAGRSLLGSRTHFSDIIVNAVLSSQKIEMFTDAVRSITDYDTVANLALDLFDYQGSLPEVINVCVDKAVSKYEIGVELARSIGADETLIVPAKTSSFGSEHAPRSLYAAMDNSLLKSLLGRDEIVINYSKIMGM